MPELLKGVTVAVAGDERPLRVAARFLSDLGAEVHKASESNPSDEDRLWLGDASPLPVGRRPDIVLRGELSAPDSGGAGAVVRYRPVSATARNAGQRLCERELTAVGGMAVAVGEPERPPLPMASGSIDAMIGAHIAAAALAAMLEDVRETEVAGADVVAWAVATNLQLYLPYGIPWHRDGRRASGSGSCYPWALFDAADGPFCIIGRTDEDWRALRSAMGNPRWAQAERFADPRVFGRLYPQDADVHVASWAERHTRSELMRIMLDNRVAGAPVLSPDEVLKLPSLAGRWRARVAGSASVRVPGPAFDCLTVPHTATVKPLAGVVVLDLSWVWSGPAVGVAMADLGANVIKVESATRPDNSRLRGRPPTGVVGKRAPLGEVAPYFHALNRGKRSISLDLKTEAGREALLKLASRADLIIENLTAGVMDRFGIPPERVLERNPACVFLSMRGYREHPSTAGLRAYAPTLSSTAGLEAVIGYPGEPPLGAMSVAFSDALATSQGLLLALAGLKGRMTNGVGAAVTLSQLESAVFANGFNLVADQLGGAVNGLEPFVAGDGHLVEGTALRDSDWISPDLLVDVYPKYLEKVTVARLPWRRDGQPCAVGKAAPLLGEHTNEIFVQHSLV
jgi:crotonobetainyl-CoA:carnitine CoA-transferase CaiB-like acyl-CoA transferase